MRKQNELDVARAEINAIDAEMASLFVRRMQAVDRVSDYKMRHGLQIYDPSRENEIIARNATRVADDALRGFYTDFLTATMQISRHYQDKKMHGMKVAFSGVEGAFAAIAAGKIFKNATRVAHPDFASAYQSVVDGSCDCVVLPIENSTAGEVGPVLDMLFSGPLWLTGVYDLFVHQHLLGLPGATRAGIRKVISHPQALAQCAPYLREHGMETEEFENTALAAKYVKKAEDPTLAAIASEETAALYDMEIIEKNINDKNINMTRFAVLSRAAVTNTTEKGRHSILFFTVSNKAGALAEAIHIIGKYGYNMRCLRSRPMKELVFQYYFYVETEGDLATPRGNEMLAALSPYCDKLKMLGSFNYPAELH